MLCSVLSLNAKRISSIFCIDSETNAPGTNLLTPTPLESYLARGHLLEALLCSLSSLNFIPPRRIRILTVDAEHAIDRRSYIRVTDGGLSETNHSDGASHPSRPAVAGNLLVRDTLAPPVQTVCSLSPAQALAGLGASEGPARVHSTGCPTPSPWYGVPERGTKCVCCMTRLTIGCAW